ncbi:MAG: DUF1697 domain-containing protein [Solirubrobacteraceae bacterium]
MLLLRGINLGTRNRIAMPDLRAALQRAGFQDVQTYLQSGNVIVHGELPAPEAEGLARDCIRDSFGLEIPVLLRTGEELLAVMARNPFGEVRQPKLVQVTFLQRELAPETVDQLAALATGSERLVVGGRELYAEHPEGLARSKLASRLAGRSLGVTATARNWITVTSLVERVRVPP